MPSPLPPSPPLVSSTGRPFKARTGRPSKNVLRGRKARFTQLLRAGELGEAQRWHVAHDLARYGVPPPPAADPIGPDHAYGDHGGAGGQQRHGRSNWDKTTQNGQNLQYGCTTTPAVQNSQCSPLATARAVPLAVEADLTRLAAKAVYTPTVTPPAGESEGERGFGQAESRSGADNVGVTDKIVSVWPEGGEGIVGKMCRNKQYNELRVMGEKGELWTKVGNWQFTGGLVRGERVLVNRVWVSGDDTDAEYEVVRRMDVNEDVPQVPTVVEEPQPESGSDSGSESAAVPEQGTPVAILPQFQREEPDYPRKQESADDYIARIRAEAAMWANGQGR